MDAGDRWASRGFCRLTTRPTCLTHFRPREFNRWSLAQTQVHPLIGDGGHAVPLQGNALAGHHPDRMRSGEDKRLSVVSLLP